VHAVARDERDEFAAVLEWDQLGEFHAIQRAGAAELAPGSVA
jgi:hypothetical protein